MKKHHVKRLNNLFVKISAICIALMIVPMLVNFFYTSSTASKALESEAGSSLTTLAKEKNKQVDVIFDLQFQISNAMINEIFMVDFFKEIANGKAIDSSKVAKISDNLNSRLTNANGLYENIFFTYDDKVFMDGIKGNSVGYKLDPQLEAYYFEQLKNPGVSISDYMYSPITGRPVIAIANSIVDETTNKVLSVLVLAVDLSKLTEQLAISNTEEQINTMILDPSGLVLASNNPEHTLKLNFSKETGDIQAYYAKMNEQSSGLGKITIDGVQQMASYVKDDKYGLYILTLIPVVEYMKKVDSLQSGLLLVIALSILLSAMIILFYVNKIIKPIKLVSKAAQQIALGDLSAEQIHLKNKDEIGELAGAFNAMLLHLRDMIARVSLSSEQVAASSEQLSATSELSSKVSEQIAKATQQVAAGSEDQSRLASYSSDMINEVAAGMRQVTVNAQHVTNNSLETSQKAKQGATIIYAAIADIEAIHENIQHVAEKIISQGEQSKKIGQIVEVITQIATQTNLLALNASIEAARAGELGLGFAVVAGEVRKLAEESKQASEQIKELITSVLGNTEQTVLSMEHTVEQSSKGIEAIKSVEQTFDDIQHSVNQVTDQMQEVNTASHQMMVPIEQIANHINQIASISTEAASKTQQVSASVEEQSASSGKMTASAMSLAKLAEEMQELIQRFRI
ncbi:methyl-accepting chemotaxis protein [Paenibacillus sp. sgz302251]|uniref:methyl-accepting chemotaxis protein n=1 Tax=Paenibacillus sp. sgz302251 TaxID=3414493 RepID=UPI003C7EC7DD